MVGTNVIVGGLISIVIMAGLYTGVSAQSEEGLVAEWHFDEGSGNIAGDRSGSGNDGIIHGTIHQEQCI